MKLLTKDHDCIGNIRDKIKEADPLVTGVKIDLSTIVNSDFTGINMTGQRIVVFMEKKKKDGSPKHVQEKTFITHNYCPFCGGKYPSK